MAECLGAAFGGGDFRVVSPGAGEQRFEDVTAFAGEGDGFFGKMEVPPRGMDLLGEAEFEGVDFCQRGLGLAGGGGGFAPAFSGEWNFLR